MISAEAVYGPKKNSKQWSPETKNLRKKREGFFLLVFEGKNDRLRMVLFLFIPIFAHLQLGIACNLGKVLDSSQ